MHLGETKRPGVLGKEPADCATSVRKNSCLCEEAQEPRVVCAYLTTACRFGSLDSTILTRPGSGFISGGMESHVLRPIITAFMRQLCAPFSFSTLEPGWPNTGWTAVVS